MKYFTFLLLFLINGLISQNVNPGTLSLSDLISEQALQSHFYDRYTPEPKLISTINNSEIKPLSHVLAWGEKNEFSLEGKLYDSESKEELLFGTVGLYTGDELIAGTATDVKGNYSLKKLKAGNYTLKASYVGYEEVVQEIEIKKNKVLDIELDGGVGILLCNGVVITAYKVKFDRCTWTCGEIVEPTEGIKNCLSCFAEEEDSIEIEITEQLENSSFSFFPNPAVDQIQINIEEKTELLIITTASGSVMYRKELPAEGRNRIYLQDYINGTYFVTAVVSGKPTTKKLIVVNH